jgi:hypothetical protein
MSDIPDTENGYEAATSCQRKFCVISRTFEPSIGRKNTVEAMNMGSGVIIRSSTEQTSHDNTVSIAESMVFVKNMRITGDESKGYQIIPC